MKKLLLLAGISVLFWGCDDETQPSGGGQARIIVNCPAPNQALGESFQFSSPNGGTLFSPGSTDVFSVTKGQNVSAVVTYSTLVCKNVEVKFELNGSIVETRNYQMGGLQLTTCPDGYNKSVNFIVP
jgi:hypothetical protein